MCWQRCKCISRLCAAVLLAALPIHIKAQTPASSIWQVVTTPNLGPNNILLGISASAENDVWAVGDLVSLHFDGTKWNAIPVVGTNSGNAETLLKAVAPVSPTNVWAVGYAFLPAANHNIALIEHFDGNKWSVAGVVQGAVLNAIQATSSDDIYAVGASDADSPSFEDPLVLHFNGTTWNNVPTPHIPKGKGIALNQLAIVSPSDIWAVGASGGLQPKLPFAMHFDGTAWKEVPVPANGTPNFASLLGVSAVATDDVWAVGFFQGSNNVTVTLAEHWDGKSWNIVPTPNVGPSSFGGDELFGVAAISTNDVWACGGFSNVLIEHFDGKEWTISPAPQPLFPGAKAIFAFPSGSVFVAGEHIDSTSLILHTTQGL